MEREQSRRRGGKRPRRGGRVLLSDPAFDFWQLFKIALSLLLYDLLGLVIGTENTVAFKR
jgi:hypothetical protein